VRAAQPRHEAGPAEPDPWQVLRPLLDGRPYLPWTEGALSPAALVYVMNEIVLGGRREIVELGAGVSTVVLARLLAQEGGTLTTLEHDRNWAGLVRSWLEREDLGGIARLIERPLVPHPDSLDGAPWYSPEAIAELPRSIDLLLIDGPPGYGDGMSRSRFPALPVLTGKLGPGAMFVLDDANRAPEREIAEYWSAEFSDCTVGIDERTGIAVGRRKSPV
jgi:hypothetical protein